MDSSNIYVYGLFQFWTLSILISVIFICFLEFLNEFSIFNVLITKKNLQEIGKGRKYSYEHRTKLVFSKLSHTPKHQTVVITVHEEIHVLSFSVYILL